MGGTFNAQKNMGGTVDAMANLDQQIHSLQADISACEGRVCGLERKLVLAALPGATINAKGLQVELAREKAKIKTLTKQRQHLKNEQSKNF